jgi:hypothetical protein
MLAGLTALSVEISTKVPTRCRSAASASHRAHVVAKGLADLRLQDRQVLVGGGMENHVGTVFAHHFLDRCRIADIAQHAVKNQVLELAAQFEIDAVQRILAVVDQDQFHRVEARDLPAQLGTDRTAAAGDHDALAGQPITDRIPHQGDGLTAQQVIDHNALEVVDAGGLAAQLVQRRQGAEFDAALLADLDDALHLLIGGRRHRDDGQVGADFAADPRQLVDGAQDWNAVHLRAAQAFVVVQEPDDSEAPRWCNSRSSKARSARRRAAARVAGRRPWPSGNRESFQTR